MDSNSKMVAKNVGIHGLPDAIFEMSAVENDEKPKLAFLITQLLFIIDLQFFLFLYIFLYIYIEGALA